MPKQEETRSQYVCKLRTTLFCRRNVHSSEPNVSKQSAAASCNIANDKTIKIPERSDKHEMFTAKKEEFDANKKPQIYFFDVNLKQCNDLLRNHVFLSLLSFKSLKKCHFRFFFTFPFDKKQKGRKLE
jgi:hypothetical protein